MEAPLAHIRAVQVAPEEGGITTAVYKSHVGYGVLATTDSSMVD